MEEKLLLQLVYIFGLFSAPVRVKIIAKFDPILKGHLNSISKKEHIKNHYLGKDTQNEFIQLMANHVVSKIRVKILKYYAIILDFTRDIARVEQLSVVLRTTDLETARIEEHFVRFVAVDTTTAEGLTDYLLNELEKLGLNLANCRGQSYDNDSNMRGVHNGVQQKILNLNPLAFFVPCGSHSWNLVLGDAASSSVQAQTFFGTLQRLYTIFFSSSQRWSILKEHVNISLKPLSETRWECRVESVKAVRFQLDQVCDALCSLREKSTDCALISECQSLENQISTFKFIVSLVIWYDILIQIHAISKMWQSPSINLEAAIHYLKVFLNWLDQYRNNGFDSALVAAREVAEETGLTETTFKSPRIRRKKKMFDYEATDEGHELAPKEAFRISYFNVVVDTIRVSCEPRFEALKQHENIFGFLYNVLNVSSMPDKELLNHCEDLQIALTDGNQRDIDGLELFEELKIFPNVVEEADKKSKEKSQLNQSGILRALKFITINNLSDIYPNLFIALRIVLTIPVTVAAAERSFSILKLIKTYLRNTMTQHRLSSLAISSIENEVSHSLDFKALIDDFAHKKSRRVQF